MSELKTNLQEILQEKQEKIIPENIKKDVQIFDVVGTLEGGTTTSGVKLFETEEEMQADSTAQEGDLAVVYREETQNMTAETQTQYITFPETVVLPEAFTSDVYCMLRAADETVMFNGQVMLNQSMFDFNGYSETGMIRVGYQSEDGITYTRQEFMGDSGDLTNPVDLGTAVKYEPMEPWNDTLGYFMQIGGNVFDGLYQAKEGLDYNYIYGLGNIVSSDDITYTENTLIEISNVIDTILENSELGINTLCFKMNNILYIVKNTRELYSIVGEIGFRLSSPHGNSEQNIECATVNMDTLEVTQSPLTIDTNYAIINGNTKWYMSLEVFNNIDYAFILYGDFNGNIYTSNINISALENNTLNFTTVVDFTCYFKSFIAYKFANNQFTLTSPNQLLPGISAYGKNGNVIGDGSIWNSMSSAEFRKLIYNADYSDDELIDQLIKIENVPSLDNNITIYGIDYDLSEPTTSNYVYDQCLFRITNKSMGTEPSTVPVTYENRQIFSISRDEIYILSNAESASNGNYRLRIYKYHIEENAFVFDDYVESTNISISSFENEQAVCRYKDNIIYIVCTIRNSTFTSYDYGYPALITYDTINRTFTKVKQCNTLSRINGIIDFDVDTGLCYFINDNNLYKWNTSTTSAESIVEDTYDWGYMNLSDGIVEYLDNEYFVVIGASHIAVINRQTGNVTLLADELVTNKEFSRGRFIQIGNYLYVLCYNPNADYTIKGTYVAKIDISSMSIVSSKFHYGVQICMRGKSKNSMFMFNNVSNMLYITSCKSYKGGSGGDNKYDIYSLNLDTLDIKPLTLLYEGFGSNCGVISGLENYDTSYTISNNIFQYISFYEAGYEQYDYTFILANITDFMHNDIPMILDGVIDYTGYINSINKDSMMEYFSQNYAGTISPEEYNTALNTAKQIEGEEEIVNE